MKFYTIKETEYDESNVMMLEIANERLEKTVKRYKAALETIAEDKMKCNEFGLNWEAYSLVAKNALEDK